MLGLGKSKNSICKNIFPIPYPLSLTNVIILIRLSLLINIIKYILYLNISYILNHNTILILINISLFIFNSLYNSI
jgi:hypothetical protein